MSSTVQTQQDEKHDQADIAQARKIFRRSHRAAPVTLAQQRSDFAKVRLVELARTVNAALGRTAFQHSFRHSWVIVRLRLAVRQIRRDMLKHLRG